MTESSVVSRRRYSPTLRLVVLLLVVFWGRAVEPQPLKTTNVNLAFVGVGGRGGSNLKTLYDSGSVNVVGICDVNSSHLDRTAERHSRAESTLYQFSTK